jgi:hypothetical protein
MTAVSLCIALYGLRTNARRHNSRRCERFRSFKGWGVEWTAYNRDDDRQS